MSIQLRIRHVMSVASIATLCVACSSGNGSYSGADGGLGTGSGAVSGGNGTASNPLTCMQKSADNSDDDCVKLGKGRKLDCESEEEADAALAVGCVREDPTDIDDWDVCCATTVVGTKITNVSCRQKGGADDDPECATFPDTPKKLDCDTETNVKAALQAGCVRQKAGKTDVCCPRTVVGNPV